MVSYERDTFNKTIANLDKEKGILELEKASKVKEVETLQGALTGYM